MWSILFLMLSHLLIQHLFLTVPHSNCCFLSSNGFFNGLIRWPSTVRSVSYPQLVAHIIRSPCRIKTEQTTKQTKQTNNKTTIVLEEPNF